MCCKCIEGRDESTSSKDASLIHVTTRFTAASSRGHLIYERSAWNITPVSIFLVFSNASRWQGPISSRHVVS